MRILYKVRFQGEPGEETLDADHVFQPGEKLPERFKGDKVWQVVSRFHQYKLNAPLLPENIVCGTLEAAPI